MARLNNAEQGFWLVSSKVYQRARQADMQANDDTDLVLVAVFIIEIDAKRWAEEQNKKEGWECYIVKTSSPELIDFWDPTQVPARVV